MKFNFLTRIRIISGFIFLFAIFLIGRLYFLQIVNNDVYLDKADKQYTSSAVSIFSRGTIYFQNKNGEVVSAATLKSGSIIALNPKIITNPEELYAKLNPIFPIDKDIFMAKATKKNDPYEELSKKVDLEIGQKVEALKIPGLNVYKDRFRFYPGESIASRTIGILGYKENEYAGRYGLERQYEDILKRDGGEDVNFFAELFSNIKNSATSKEMEGDIVTTIEPTVETYLESEIASTTSRWNSDYTGGIIINPKTGEIYAMDIYPTFDPNNSQLEKNVSVFSNPLVESIYEMGSIIKPLTIAAGIDAGVITAASTYYDNGFVMINGKKISNFDGKERGVVNMQEVLSQSLNVGVAHVEKLLGNKRFAEYMYNFGVAEKTNIDLPNEAKNMTRSLEGNNDIDFATMSFGQGISFTPISTVRLLSTIANGGVLITPHVVKKINYKIGTSKEIPIVIGRRVIKRETAEEVARMMVWSVDNALANGKMKLTNYSVAAKTGTAQIANRSTGGYSESEVLHSFVGFFPAYDPKFLIFLYTVNPKGVKYGSETLTGPFMNIVKFLVNYYDVPPDR